MAITDLWGVPGAAGGVVYAGGIFGLGRWSGAAWTDISDDVAMRRRGSGASPTTTSGRRATSGRSRTGTGASWTDTLPVNDDKFQDSHTSLWGAAPDDVWAVGDGGAISHWDGAGWTQIQYGAVSVLPVPHQGARLVGGRRLGRRPRLDGTNAPVILHNVK